jgi:nucleotide-binding universal stress UspA family protein
MYKAILVPTDGSDLANKAVKEAAMLAKAGGARLVLFHAVRPRPQPLYAEGIAVPYPPVHSEEGRKQLEAEAQAVLAAAAKQAGDCPLEWDFAISERPHQAIVDSAAKHECDLIAMASHGYGGFTGLILGSETQKVLANCKVPVLVVR